MIMKKIILCFVALMFMMFLPFSMMYGQMSTEEEMDTTLNRNDCVNTGTYTNINCPLGANWKNEAKAVVKIEMPLPNGECDNCTGSLVNTTLGENNDRHFILTARHCLRNDSPVSGWKFYWHYEYPECNPPYSALSEEIYTTGASVVSHGMVDNFFGDFALLKLNTDPAEAWDVTPYYLGWDASGDQSGSRKMIYHPAGNDKKIKSYSYTSGEWIFNKGSNLDMYYCNGVYMGGANCKLNAGNLNVAGGSSGAPLLSDNKLIVGLLSKGNDCLCIYSSKDLACNWFNIFCKFNYAWEGHCDVDSTERLKDWLDPINTGQTVLDGRAVCQKNIRLRHSLPREDYHAVDSVISKQEIDSGFTVSYKAGTEIVFMADTNGYGFHVQAGANFTAQIEPLDCNSINPPSFSSPREEEEEDVINFQLSKSQNSYKINLLPNPNSGTFQLETNFSLADISHLKITNMLGVSVYETQKITSNTIQLQTTPNGLYFVVIILKDGNLLTEKMMIQR